MEPYRRRAEELRLELENEYLSYLPILEECYSSASYWHGTGHYHYYHSNDSRYGTVDTTRTVDVLASIINHKGLTGHQDLWVVVGGKTLKTISLAPSRMHARLYAHIHLRDGVWLQYVFGGTRFWMSIFVLVAAQELLSHLGHSQRAFIKQTVFNASTLHHARTWASAIRNLEEYKVLPFWRAYDLRSDIVGNHPILFGIKKEAVQGDGVVPFLRKVEVRTHGPISFEHFTHVEVPQEHVGSVRTLFLQKGISMPVIPLEFGELYCSRIPMSKLIYV